MDGCLSMETREYEADGWMPFHVHEGWRVRGRWMDAYPCPWRLECKRQMEGYLSMSMEESYVRSSWMDAFPYPWRLESKRQMDGCIKRLNLKKRKIRCPLYAADL